MFFSIGCPKCQSANEEYNVEVYNDSNKTYTHQPGIYGIYKLQHDTINGRAYFKNGKYILAWDENDDWVIPDI